MHVFRAWVKRFRPAYITQEASQSDLMALYAWLNPNGEQALPASERNDNPNLTNYVARRGEEVLGFVRLMRHPETDFPHTGHCLYSLTVRTRYRGMGIGASLTQRAIDQSRVEGAAELCLCVFENNAPAIALYRELGFERVALPALEAELAADVRKYGRQRVPLRKPLG
jgi:ribosomal protein S18 acetylase RimI-like enzyme